MYVQLYALKIFAEAFGERNIKFLILTLNFFYYFVKNISKMSRNENKYFD